MKKLVWLCSLLTTALVINSTGLGRTEVKPGDTITKENLAEAGDLLIPSTRWMLEQGMTMEIIETKKVQWPKAYTEATEKYSGQVEISEDGRAIYNYIAGCPFPNIDINDPLAGFKVMWNHAQPPYLTDNAGTELIAEMVNRRGEIERTYATSWRRMMWTGRLYTEPKPAIPHNPPLRHANIFGPNSRPQEYKGSAVLYFRYLSPDVADDTYVYTPERRRVTRITETNRSDPLWGTDVDIDSFYGFNGKIGNWTFRVLAQKDILAIVHSGKYGDRSAWCAPRDGTHGFVAALPCVSWEKRRVWVIEGTPTGYRGKYAYSKRLLYIDLDFLAPVLHETYDQNGELWKFIVPSIFYAKKPYAGYPTNPLKGGKYNYQDEWPFTPNWLMVDIQRVHATTGDAPSGHKKPWEWQKEWYFNEDIPSNNPKNYSTNYLIRSAR